MGVSGNGWAEGVLGEGGSCANVPRSTVASALNPSRLSLTVVSPPSLLALISMQRPFHPPEIGIPLLPLICIFSGLGQIMEKSETDDNRFRI